MSKIIKTMLKDPDNSVSLSVKLDDKNQDYLNTQNYIEINKPINRNVWEQDEAFMTDNGLTSETEEDKLFAIQM